MNDPGLDEPISNDAKDVENQKIDEKDEKEEDEQEFLEPRFVSLLAKGTRLWVYRVASHFAGNG